MVQIPDFDHKLDKKASYDIRISSARWLLAYTSVVIILYIYLPKLSISYAFHKPGVNNGDQQRRKRSLLNVNNSLLVIAVLLGFLYNSFLSYIKSLDLLLITKRLGRNCMSLYVPLLFLTMRPSPLPNVLYLNLIPIHKWLGRLLVFQALIHSILYTYFYYKTGVLWKLTKLANVYGILSMVGFLLIAGLSISKMRRKDYRIFYISHYMITWMTVIMLQYHARPRATYYTVANVTILLIQIGYRIYLTREIEFDDVEEISDSFKRVKFSSALLAQKPISPGCHLRINNKHNSIIKNIFFNFLVPLQHPYTIESLPSEEKCTLIIKNGRFPIVQGQKYYVTGSFEPKLPFFNNNIFFKNESIRKQSLLTTGISSLFGNKNKKVIIVTGGSALSFGLPILQTLNAENYKCRMYWITRDLSDLNLIKKNYQNLEIFITKTTTEKENVILDNNSFNAELDLESNAFTENNSPLLGNIANVDAEVLLNGDHSSKLNKYDADTNFSSILYKNYGLNDESNDEIDFTAMPIEEMRKKSSQMLAGNNFREPSTLIDLDYQPDALPTQNNPPRKVSKMYGSLEMEDSSKSTTAHSNNAKITIPKGLKVSFGRPTLGFKELLWISKKSNLNKGECNGNNLSDSACLENLYLQALGMNNNKVDNNSGDEKNDVLVIAAGPLGLVESTKKWAVLHNFQFYEESFFL